MSAVRRGVRHTPALVRWVVLGGLGVLLAWGGWISVRALVVQDRLTAAIPVVYQLRESVLAGEATSVDRLAADLQGHADAAYDMTHDPIWGLTESVPWLGPNLTAIREVSEIVSLLASQGVDPLLEAAAGADPSSFAISNGRINLEPLLALQDDLAVANTVMLSAAARADVIDASGAIGPVRNAVERLVALVREVSAAVDALNRVSHLLPGMLGAEHERQTLVLIQNNAELRASGGISGALAVISSSGGALTLAGQASTSDFRPAYNESILPLDDATVSLYGDITGRYIQDVNLTPWFDTTAQLAKAMWEDRIGGEIDAVVAVDPVLLSYVLRATGPVDVGGVRLDSDNVVQVLLSDVYSMFEKSSDQDLFFAAAAQAVFARLTDGQVDPRLLIDALVQGSEENRVRVWSAHPGEQRYIDGTSLSGRLPEDNSGGPVLGVFFNDGTGAKMNYYTDIASSVGMAVCRADGRPLYRVSVTITNSAPADAAITLPRYVTGGGEYGTPPGSIEMFVATYGPVGATAELVTLNGESVAVQLVEDRERPVVQASFELQPGDAATLEVEYLGSTPSKGPLQVMHTPTINVIETQHRALGC